MCVCEFFLSTSTNENREFSIRSPYILPSILRLILGAFSASCSCPPVSVASRINDFPSDNLTICPTYSGTL